MSNITEIANEGKIFDFVLNGNIISLKVRELTVREKGKIATILEEKIKDVARKEALEISKLLPEKERNRYLIEVAKSNSKISSDEVNDAAESIFGFITVLTISTGKTDINWEDMYIGDSENCLKAYYYALYGKIVEDIIDSPKETKKEVEQAEKFC